MSEAYKKSGVDVNRGYEAVERIKPYAKKTFRPGVMSSIGSFAGLFDLKALQMNDPILVSGTDGVGTKLLLAQQFNQHDTIGQDLVAMCVNDILTTGATPLFFLDYIAVGKIDPNHIESIMKGIHQGCMLSHCALIGGETAEMPDMYQEGHYDLAGFAVGAVERDKMITGEEIEPGDIILGLASSGIHSNGYSLVRKILSENTQIVVDDALISMILEPTRIYAKPILHVLSRVKIKGMAHITGGGFDENIPRMLPKDYGAVIDKQSFSKPEIFNIIQKASSLLDRELYQVFNMGIGMVLVVKPEDQDLAIQSFHEVSEDVKVIGYVTHEKGLKLI
jgi:phosphoribosylformylglycinamidine cyclo-ligase